MRVEPLDRGKGAELPDSFPIPSELKKRIFDAAQRELLATGIDRFKIDGVARRAGVEPDVIVRYWRDRRVLLIDAVLDRTRAARWNPDTGAVRTDLDVVSALAIELSQTAQGRALFRRLLPGDADADLAEICSDVWDVRFADAAQILRRAAARGQLREGVDPQEAIRMFAAAFYYDVIFTDSPVRPQYAERVVDVFLNGVLRTADSGQGWPDVEGLLPNPRPGDAGGATDQAVEAARRAVVLMRVWADALLDPVVLYEAVRDGDGRIVDFVCRDLNRAACEEVGLTRQELLGRSMVETLPNVASSELIQLYADCLQTGEPLVLNDFPYRHFDEDRRLDLRVTTAAPGVITVTWRDVSDR